MYRKYKKINEQTKNLKLENNYSKPTVYRVNIQKSKVNTFPTYQPQVGFKIKNTILFTLAPEK